MQRLPLKLNAMARRCCNYYLTLAQRMRTLTSVTPAILLIGTLYNVQQKTTGISRSVAPGSRWRNIHPLSHQRGGCK